MASRTKPGSGLFIVFEGGDGAGKTKAANGLYERLQRKGYRDRVILTRQPPDTSDGNVLRRVMSSPQSWLTVPTTELSQFLLVEPPVADSTAPGVILKPHEAHWFELIYFMTMRARLVSEVIRPSLEKGQIVICDRHAASSVAYQGYGRGLDLRMIAAANRIAAPGIQPDLVFLLDVDPEEGLKRKQRAGRRGPFGEAEIEFQKRVRESYLKMAMDNPEIWIKVDGTWSTRKIGNFVWKQVEPFLSRI